MNIKKMLAPWEKSYDKPRRHIKKQRHYFANKVPSSQSYGFSKTSLNIWNLMVHILLKPGLDETQLN